MNGQHLLYKQIIVLYIVNIYTSYKQVIIYHNKQKVVERLTMPMKILQAAFRDSIAVVPIVNCINQAILHTTNCMRPQ
jgi:hypothetical protein